jgi:hypothetical protein
MADELDEDSSRIVTEVPNKSLANNPSNPLATSYDFIINLKDQYQNNILPVRVDGVNTKAVQTTFIFEN